MTKGSQKKLCIKTNNGSYFNDNKNRESLYVEWDTIFTQEAIAIGINPSKANDKQSDTTLTKLARYLDKYKFKSILMLNIFTCYATNQKDIDTDSTTDFSKYKNNFINADWIVIVWGIKESDFRDEKIKILNILKEYSNKVYCIQNKKKKKPMHPSRMDYDWSIVKFFDNE